MGAEDQGLRSVRVVDLCRRMFPIEQSAVVVESYGWVEYGVIRDEEGCGFLTPPVPPAFGRHPSSYGSTLEIESSDELARRPCMRTSDGPVFAHRAGRLGVCSLATTHSRSQSPPPRIDADDFDLAICNRAPVICAWPTFDRVLRIDIFALRSDGLRAHGARDADGAESTNSDISRAQDGRRRIAHKSRGETLDVTGEKNGLGAVCRGKHTRELKE